MRLLPILALVSLAPACAHNEPASAPVATAEPKRVKDPCREAEKLRRSGFTKLLDLDLKGARSDFNAALKLDPGNTGALQQLAVIDAMESGSSQVGASAANNNMTSQASRSHCREGQDTPTTEVTPKPQTQKAKPAKGIADLDGQVGLSSAGHESPKLTTQTVKEAVRRVRPEITICYQRALNRQITLQGNVVIRFTISDDGKVQPPDAEDDTLGDSELASYVEKIVAGLSFPKTKGSTHFVSYPMSFR